MNQSLQLKETGKQQQRSSLMVTILVLGLIIILTFLLSDYFKQMRIQDNISLQIERGVQELAWMESPSPGLLEKLEEIRSENNSLMASLSSESVNTREIIEALLEAAGMCGLKSNNLTTDDWQVQDTEDNIYCFMPVSVNLSGTVPDLLRFIETLENRHMFPSLVIQDLSLSGMNNSTPEQAFLDSDPAVDARLTISIVTRTEPDAEEY
ncbi:MAG: hypothetical protein JXA46_19445 [Dehalococcoidales bacterium]|nr:hypothetical protein [Dehalococcoidales bacterium]